MIQTIIFGGGCFWCVEAVVQRLKGVVSVMSGYAGGERENPTYAAVSTGTTGHAEVVKVDFDPTIISLENLLSVFFSSHDPTTVDRQGNDVGPQYRSAIYYTTDQQKEIIQKFIQNLQDEKVFSGKIVTEVQPFEHFYEAEEYHRDYYNQNTSQPYCQFVIEPKILKLRKNFAHLLKST